MLSIVSLVSRFKTPAGLGLAVLVLLAGNARPPLALSPQTSGGTQASDEPPAEATIFRNTLTPDQLSMLKGVLGRPASDLLKDGTFRKLLHAVVPATPFHFGRDMPLEDALKTVLASAPLPAQIRDGRFVMIASQGGPNFRGRGFIWFDLQAGMALGGIYFHPTNGEPTPTLTLFSKQVLDESLEMTQLPFDFFVDMRQWAATAGVPPVPTRYFINFQGRKIVLVHSEDFCGHLENEPAPPEAACEEMNEHAADLDLEAAYFLAHTHNASNATMGMAVGMDLPEWIKFRDESCGQAPDPQRCRIRLTRQRIVELAVHGEKGP
jgi:uncharacterized protein YecT (DUF1311 family)